MSGPIVVAFVIVVLVVGGLIAYAPSFLDRTVAPRSTSTRS